MEAKWSDDLEQIINKIMFNANVMSAYHKKNYIYYKGQLKFYKIPILIISGFNSVFSVGLQPFLPQQTISVLNCLLALICGIIGSIELFLQIADNMERELVASKDFYLLGVDCFKMLALERRNRTISGKDFLDEKYSDYTKLIQTSNLVQRKVIDKMTGEERSALTDVIPDAVSSESLSLLQPTPRASSEENEGV